MIGMLMQSLWDQCQALPERYRKALFIDALTLLFGILMITVLMTGPF